MTDIRREAVGLQVRWGELPAAVSSVVPTLRPQSAWYISEEKDDAGRPALLAWDLKQPPYYCFRYEDGVEFAVGQGSGSIWVRWPLPLTLEDASIYFVGPILSFVLAQSGTTCLHASAAVVGGQAVAFAGVAGRGKSSIVASLAKLGYPILADDVVALDEQADTFLAQPAHSRIRLWPATVKLLFGSEAALPRLSPDDATWDKCYLELAHNGYRFQETPVPLSRVYLLAGASSTSRPPRLEGVSPSDGVVSLVTHTYVNYLKGKAELAIDFERLSRLVKRVPIKRLYFNCTRACLARLEEVVLADLRTTG